MLGYVPYVLPPESLFLQLFPAFILFCGFGSLRERAIPNKCIFSAEIHVHLGLGTALFWVLKRRRPVFRVFFLFSYTVFAFHISRLWVWHAVHENSVA